MALPDETLHSQISRYHRLSGNRQERQTLQETFGTHLLIATANLLSHLRAFAATLPVQAQLSIERLVDTSTALPYFRPFLSPIQAEECLHAMCSNDVSSLKIGIGLVASRSNSPH